jgi:hypothetical protein
MLTPLRDSWVDVTLVVVWKRSARSVGDHSNPDMCLLSDRVSRARADVFECVQLEFFATTVSKREATLQLPGSVHPQQGQNKLSEIGLPDFIPSPVEGIPTAWLGVIQPHRDRITPSHTVGIFFGIAVSLCTTSLRFRATFLFPHTRSVCEAWIFSSFSS